MARTDTLPHFLTDVADAIRTKTGESGTIQASGFDTAIGNIPSGGGADLNDYFESSISSGTSTESGWFKVIKKMPTLSITTNATNLNYAFYRYKGTELVITGTSTKLATINSIFQGCSNLQHLDIRTLEFTKISSSTNAFSSVPTNCEIIVKDSTAKTWIQTNFSSLTNVKTVAEYEAE